MFKSVQIWMLSSSLLYKLLEAEMYQATHEEHVVWH